MFGWLANAWRVPELRRRVLFTAAILAVYRLGSWIPAPGVDQQALQSLFSGGGILTLLNLFSGSALSRFSLFALGIMPYVTASIILQLLTVVIPTLERLQKEGEAGYAKINQYTRYLTVALAAAQATGYAFLFKRQNALPNVNAGRLVIIILTLTAGCVAAHVDGRADHEARHRQRHLAPDLRVDPRLRARRRQRVDQRRHAWSACSSRSSRSRVVVAVVFVQEGQRRIPVQYARRQLGNRQTTGGATYMPLRVNMAGVIPVIFAAAIMALPPTVGQFVPAWTPFVNRHFQPTSARYLGVEALLIIVFTYFYTSVQFNPVDQADNLRKYGGYIPGIRPGPPTAAYLDRVLQRLTLPGSLFLATVAVAPSLFIKYFGFSQATGRALGGTSVLIVVGVALDTMRQMESQMMMRHYEGFLRS